MIPVTPSEKYRAFYQCKGCAERLLFDTIIDLEEYQFLLKRMLNVFGHPADHMEIIEKEEAEQYERPS